MGDQGGHERTAVAGKCRRGRITASPIKGSLKSSNARISPISLLRQDLRNLAERTGLIRA